MLCSPVLLLTLYLTEHFEILVLENPSIDEIYVAEKLLSRILRLLWC